MTNIFHKQKVNNNATIYDSVKTKHTTRNSWKERKNKLGGMKISKVKSTNILKAQRRLGSEMLTH